jgi:hypothetical protein
MALLRQRSAGPSASEMLGFRLRLHLHHMEPPAWRRCSAARRGLGRGAAAGSRSAADAGMRRRRCRMRCAGVGHAVVMGTQRRAIMREGCRLALSSASRPDAARRASVPPLVCASRSPSVHRETGDGADGELALHAQAQNSLDAASQAAPLQTHR